MGRSDSDMFHDLSRVALADGPQVFEGVDAGTVAVAPADGDRFVRGRGDLMGVAGSLNDNGSITVDVKSYWPNDYGLYCMAGNVNEWVQDVYRPLTSEDVDGLILSEAMFIPI